jgi:hypothetical protein
MSRQLPKWNTITRNTKVHLPDRWLFFDTETNAAPTDAETVHLMLRLGAACYWRRGRKGRASSEEWQSFTQAGDFLDWLTARVKSGHTLYCVAHNVAFDLLVLQAFSGLAERGFRLTRVYHRLTTTIVRFAAGARRVCFLDTMNYYPTKLKELAEHVGLRKMEIDLDTAFESEVADYCMSDVEIVKEAIARLLQTLERRDLGSWKPTGPALAFNIFRHRHMKHTIRPHHLPGVAKLERAAYVGGYTAAFRLHYRDGEPVYKLDVNSMYPAVMRGNTYPTTLVRREGKMSVRELSQWMKKHLAIARVDLDSESACYPMRNGGHVLYPLGRFATVLCTRALKQAIKRKEILSVAWALLYQPKPIFVRFVNALYSWKCAATLRGDRAATLFWKMALNGLYGKFGQRATETKLLGECDPALFKSVAEWHCPTSQWITMTYAGGTVRMSMDAGETRNSFPAISAHVTEDARLYLFKLMTIAGRENVLYCDTDSLIVNGAGWGNLRAYIDPDRLGYLKVEKTAARFVSMGKKDYLLGDERVLKGFKRPARDMFFQSQTQEQFTGLNGALSRNQQEAVYVRQVIREHNPYVMNVTLDSDLNLHPLRLPEDAAKINAVQYLAPLAREQLALWLENTDE